MGKIFQAVGKLVAPVTKVAKKVKKPEALMGIGMALTGVSFVWVIVNSTKLPEVMSETADKVEQIRDRQKELEDISQPVKVITTVTDDDGNEIGVQARVMTEEERNIELRDNRKELHKAQVNGVWQVTKKILPPTLTMILAELLKGKGMRVLRKENMALVTTVAGLEKFINYYRGNVVAAEGKEADQRYAKGIIGEKELSTIVQDKDGKEKIEKVKVPVVRDGNPWRFEYSPTYFRSATGEVDRDIMHIKNVETYFNKKYGGVKKHGKISMYEVLEYLDPIWEAIDADGTVETFCRNYGWGHKANGDDYIDLGVYRGINDAAIRGIGDTVFIECNSDGLLSEIKNQYKEKYLL